LQAFSDAIGRTFVQHFTRFQLPLCSHGSSALAELLVCFNDWHRSWHIGRLRCCVAMQFAGQQVTFCNFLFIKYIWPVVDRRSTLVI